MDTIVVAALAALAVLTTGGLVLLVLVRERGVAPARLLLFLLVFGIPLTAVANVSGTASSWVGVNMCLADLVLPCAWIAILARMVRRGDPLRLPVVGLAVAFVLWMAVTMYVGSLRFDVELLRMGNVMALVKMGMLLGYFYAITNLVRDRDDLRTFLAAWLASEALTATLGIAGSALHVGLGVATPFASGARALGTFGNPNMFAGHMLMSVSLTLAWLALGGRRILGLALLGLYGLGILASASKGGILTLAVVLGVLTLLLPRYRLRVVAAGLLGVALVSGSYFVEGTSTFVSRLLSSASWYWSSY
jgi:hypothetical protein